MKLLTHNQISYMKTTKLIIALFAVLLSFSSWAKIHDKGTVYKTADIAPNFNNLGKYYEKHVKYPKAGWKEERVGAANLQAVICRDGSVTDVTFVNVTSEPLKKELLRLVDNMTWFPAYKNNKPVSVEYNIIVKLWEIRAGSYTFNAPYGLEYVTRDARKWMKRLKKNNADASADDVETALDALGESADLFPEDAPSTIAYARLLTATGRGAEAVEAMDRCQSAYYKYYWSRDSVLALLQDHTIPLNRAYWDGRVETGITAFRAMQHHMNGSAKADSVYDYAMRLIDKRIIDHDIASLKSADQVHYANRHIELMTNSIVSEWSRGRIPVDRNAPSWQQTIRFYNVATLSHSIGYWNRKGLLDNAQVSQLTSLIEQEQNEIVNGKMAKGEVKNLFGVKAMLIWMREGNEGVKRYLAEVRQGTPSKELLKYLDRLEKNLDSNATVMADRHGVMQSLVCLLPPQDADDAARKEFYNRRRAAEKVFPIAWMMK